MISQEFDRHVFKIVATNSQDKAEDRSEKKRF